MKKSILNKFSLKNKKAFVFGGCGLIGKEITKTLEDAYKKHINSKKK